MHEKYLKNGKYNMEYNVKLTASTDMKSLKCTILDAVKDTNGIFNKQK